MKLRFRLLQSLPLLFFLIFWQLFCGMDRQRAFYFATPALVVETFAGDLLNGTLLVNSAITAFEAVSGFLLGNLIGAFVGLSLWYSESVARMSRPYLIALGAIPVFALAPMTIIWFGVGVGAKVALSFFGTVFVAASQSYRGAEEVDPLLVSRLRVFGASRQQVFRSLLLPSAGVWVLSSLRLTIGLALLGAFVGEFIAADKGLGYQIVKSSGLFDTSRVIAGVIAIVLIAMGLDKTVDALEKRSLRWRPAQEGRAAISGSATA